MKKLLLALTILIWSGPAFGRVVATITSSGQLPYHYTATQNNSRPAGQVDTILVDGVFHTNGAALYFDDYTDSAMFFGANFDGTVRDSIYFNEASGNNVNGVSASRRAPFNGIKGIALRANPSDSGWVTAPIVQGSTLAHSAYVTCVNFGGARQFVDSCALDLVSVGRCQAIVYGGNNAWGARFIGNTISTISGGYWRRDNHDGYAIYVTDLYPYDTVVLSHTYGGSYTGNRDALVHVTIKHNTIVSRAQGAVRVYARGAGGIYGYAVVVCDSNVITVDCHNGFYRYPSADDYPGDIYTVFYSSGNSYAFLGTYIGARSSISWNTIRSGTDWYGGRGIYFASNRTYADTGGIRVVGNDVVVHRGLEEYYGNQNSQAFEARQADLRDFTITGNIFVSQLDFDGLPTDGVGTMHTGPSGYAFRWEPDAGTSNNNLVEDNYFRVEEVGPNGGAKVWTVDPSTQDQIVVNFEAVEVGGADLTWRNNEVVGPALPLASLYAFGGYNGFSEDVAVWGDTAYYTDDSETVYTIVTPNRFFAYTSPAPGSYGSGNSFTDVRFGLGASFDDIHFFGSNPNGSDVTIRRSATVYVYGNNGLPVEGASVEYENTYVDPAISLGVTSSSGTVYAELDRYYTTRTGSPLTYSPYTLRAIKGADTAEVTWTMTDANLPDTLVLTATTGTGTATDQPPFVTAVSPGSGAYSVGDTIWGKVTMSDDYAIEQWWIYLHNVTQGTNTLLKTAGAQTPGLTSKIDSAQRVFSATDIGQCRILGIVKDTADSYDSLYGSAFTVTLAGVQANTGPYLFAAIQPSGVTSYVDSPGVATVTVVDSTGNLDSLRIYTDAGTLYQAGGIAAYAISPVVNFTWKAADVPETYVYIRAVDDSGAVLVDSSLLINSIYSLANGLRSGTDGADTVSVVIFGGDVRLGKRVNLQGNQ